MTQKTDDGQRDVISCDTPAEVIGALLRNLGGAASLDQIGQVGKSLLLQQGYHESEIRNENSLSCHVVRFFSLISAPGDRNWNVVEQEVQT